MKRHLIHPFLPIIDENCRILILGSVPSVKSVENNFYYMNKNNRFWKILSALFGCDLTSASPEEKRRVLLDRRVALYDAVYECDIEGSSDGKISSITPTNVLKLIENAPIERIFCNGSYSYAVMKKYFPSLLAMTEKLPSTSPANAGYTAERLLNEWKRILL